MVTQRSDGDDGKAIYVGRSPRREEDGETTVEAAIEDAWEQAKPDYPDGATLRVLEIEAEGTNPIDMYRVIAVVSG